MSQTIDLGKVVPVKGVDYWTAQEAAEVESAKTAATNAASSANQAASAANTAAGKVDASIATEKARVDAGLADLNSYKTASEQAAANANAKASIANDAATNATAAAAVANKATKDMDDVAKADHATAKSDHSQAASDHTRADGDHTTAAADHEQAVSDIGSASAYAGQAAASAASAATAAESANGYAFGVKNASGKVVTKGAQQYAENANYYQSAASLYAFGNGTNVDGAQQFMEKAQTASGTATTKASEAAGSATAAAGSATAAAGSAEAAATSAAGIQSSLEQIATNTEKVASLESQSADINRDFGKYAALADKTLTLVESGKRYNSAGELVADSNWNVGKLGAVSVGNTYELKMGASSKMVLGTALFISHTTETIGTTTKEVYTPLFSAMSTDIPASGYVCFEAMEAYEEVLVCYRTDVEGANTLLVRRYGTKASIATQINNLKKKVDLKSFADGRYPQMTAGCADNLTPRGEASAEVIAERVAGGTNSIEDGNAIIKTIKGKTIKWGQMCKFTSKSFNGLTFNVSNDCFMSVNGTATGYVGRSDVYAQDFRALVGHKYFCFNALPFQMNFYGTTKGSSWISSNYSLFYTITTEEDVRVAVNIASGTEINASGYCVCIDLTACGLESCTTPDQVAAVWGYSTWDAFAASPEFADLMAYSETPRLISSKPKAIKTTGRNLWDEQWENGYYDVVDNKLVEKAAQTTIRSKYISVLPNTKYYFQITNTHYTSGAKVLLLDSGKSVLSSINSDKGVEFTTPNNCAYVVFYTFAVSGAITYKNDICINVSDASFNGQYAPYEEHTRDLEWTKTYFPDGMRSAGSVYDEATSRKAVQRFAEIDLGDCDWSANGMVSESVKQFITTNLAIAVSNNLVFSDNTHIQGVATIGNKLRINSDIVGDAAAFKSAMSGVKLIYELATPIETEYEEKNLAYQVTKGGMEIFEHQAGESSPLNANIVYGIDSYDTIKANKAHIGTLANLATTSKADLVAAINELVARVAALETSTTNEEGTL